MDQKKFRTRIPQLLSDEILFDSDHTCCVCNEPGRPVQIHHINDDPSDNDARNLAVLCFEHHHDTQLTGGFAKRLSSGEVARYRVNWLTRVANRRTEADRLAVIKKTRQWGAITQIAEEADDWAQRRHAAEAYIAGLPAVIAHVHRNATAGYDSGITSEMIRSAGTVLDVLQMIWVHLTSWFPPNHFCDETPAQFVNTYIASRFRWHRAVYEPDGPGTAGTMIRPMLVASVSADLEVMVLETVRSLFSDGLDSVEYDAWLAQWQRAKSKATQ